MNLRLIRSAIARSCQNFTRAYIHHLFKSGEMLAMRLCVIHNLYFYNTLLEKVRNSMDSGEFDAFASRYIPVLGNRI